VHLSVLTPRKISPELINLVEAYLDERGFRREGDRHVSGSKEHFRAITIDKEPEKDLYWTFTTNEVIWFIPMTEIVLESKLTEKSHMKSYEMALDLARIIRGIVYDHLVEVAYNAEGEPFERYGLGEKLAKYGTGMKQLMQDDHLP
jgi:hypothetical protein